MADEPERMYLMGDEDGGVFLLCRTCSATGLPLAYYSTDPAPYAGIETADSIEKLAYLARRHGRKVHGDDR